MRQDNDESMILSRRLQTRSLTKIIKIERGWTKNCGSTVASISIIYQCRRQRHILKLRELSNCLLIRFIIFFLFNFVLYLT